MERTIERWMDCIMMVGEREWNNCKASDIIRDILAYFSEKIEQDIQLVFIWEDILFTHLHFKWSTIKHMLDTIARYTGSRMLCQGTRISFVKDEGILPTRFL